tara:strand:- start:974 stop:1561 length:588 start_codon:yes stop_codon:yes gene_type:complete
MHNYHNKSQLIFFFSSKGVFLISLMQNVVMESFIEKISSKQVLSVLQQYSRFLTRNIDDAEDLMQDTLKKALENQTQFTRDDLEPWLITIMKNAFRDKLRKKKEYQLHEDEEIKLSDNVNNEDKLIEDEINKLKEKRLDYCVKSLKKDDYELFTYQQNGYKYAKIAKMLCLSDSNVRVKITRIRENLFNCMKEAY